MHRLCNTVRTAANWSDRKALVKWHGAEGRLVVQDPDSLLQGRCQGFDSPRLHQFFAMNGQVYDLAICALLRVDRWRNRVLEHHVDEWLQWRGRQGYHRICGAVVEVDLIVALHETDREHNIADIADALVRHLG